MICIEYSEAMKCKDYKPKLNWLDKLILGMCVKRLLSNFTIVKNGYKMSVVVKVRDGKKKEYYIEIYGISPVDDY